MAYSKNLGNVKGDKGAVFKPNVEKTDEDKIEFNWELQDKKELSENDLTKIISLPYYVPIINETQIQWVLNDAVGEPASIDLEELRGPQGHPGITVETVPNYDGDPNYIEYAQNNNLDESDDINRIIYYHHYGEGVIVTPIETGIIFLILDAIDPNDETKKTTLAYVYNKKEINIENTEESQEPQENNEEQQESIEQENNEEEDEEYYRYIYDEDNKINVSYDIRNFVKIEQPIDLTNYYNKTHINENYYTKIEIDNIFERIKDIQERIINILDGDLTKFTITEDVIDDINNILDSTHNYSLEFYIYNENNEESQEPQEPVTPEGNNETIEENEEQQEPEENNETEITSIVAYVKDEDDDKYLENIVVVLECSHDIPIEPENNEEPQEPVTPEGNEEPQEPVTSEGNNETLEGNEETEPEITEEYNDENDIIVETYIGKTDSEGKVIFNLYLEEYNKIQVKVVINNEDVYGTYRDAQENEDQKTLIIDNRG